MKHTCLNCDLEFYPVPFLDDLGHHAVCPHCESSFDIDLDAENE